MTEQAAGDLIEYGKCPNCGSGSCSTVRPAQYGADLRREETLRMYSSSSNHVLLDALVSCDACKLLYLNPRIKSDIIIESYTQAEDDLFVSQNDERVVTFKRNLARLDAVHGISARTHPRILDVGAAGGAFVKAATDLGFDAVGIEPSRWLVDWGRKFYGIDLRQGVLDQHDFPEQSFDVVSLWDVVEHLPDPRAVVDHIHRLLKPGGCLIVNYPDYDSLAHKVLRDKWPMLLSVHLTYFTRKTISDFLARSRFEIVELRPFWQSLKLQYVLRRAEAYIPAFRYIRSAIQSMGLGDLQVTYNIGQTFVLARRPR